MSGLWSILDPWLLDARLNYSGIKSLLNILLAQTQPNKYLRCKARIAELDYDITYIKGSFNRVADWLSRYSHFEKTDQQIENKKELNGRIAKEMKLLSFRNEKEIEQLVDNDSMKDFGEMQHENRKR